MTRRREQHLTYVLLGVFSLIALVPIVGIVVTALQDAGSVPPFGVFDGLPLRATSPPRGSEGNFADVPAARA